MRAREASREFLDEYTTVVLPADLELFRLLYDSGHYSKPEPSGAGAADGEATPAGDAEDLDGPTAGTPDLDSAPGSNRAEPAAEKNQPAGGG
jgi:hypothetical protein